MASDFASSTYSSVDLTTGFSGILKNIQTYGSALQTQMSSLSSTTSLSSEQLIKLQFDISQYSTMLETLSTITKGITDEAKNIAQRAS